jgi:hypothetical protein
MAVRLMLPEEMASLSTGATLSVSTSNLARSTSTHSLWWIGGIDNHGLLGFVIDDEVGVVVATTDP